ncbi:MAG: DoxX family protein [Chitinophaga sp.]|uniref:DoxX family protein n=1 Tax=Chitinophaga sp. TaxID=1869181 RepID=UPI0025BBE6ED|nr:DoxX family protein [Chitinophaga sp.]MBV8252213.1 DoxX family protein [Chitinophaga sp.]
MQLAGKTHWSFSTRTIVYWIATIIILLETAVGSYWDLAQIPFVQQVFVKLGYPSYLLYIIGAWKIAAVFILITPKLGRQKEWAYCGIFLIYITAAYSHIAAHDAAGAAGPIVFAVLSLLSWATRPDSRKWLIPETTTTTKTAFKIIYWVVTVITALVMLSGGFADIVMASGPLEGMRQLGYPDFFTPLLGIYKALGGATILLPNKRFRIIKEWAYAGIIFDLTGASLSHAFVGNHMHIIWPWMFVVTTFVSWRLAAFRK